MNENKPVKHGALWTVLFAVVSLFWIFPIVLVLINSFKTNAAVIPIRSPCPMRTPSWAGRTISRA